MAGFEKYKKKRTATIVVSLYNFCVNTPLASSEQLLAFSTNRAYERARLLDKQLLYKE